MSHSINLEEKRILIVDDEPDILETLEEILSMSQVDTASSYEQAGSLLDTHTYDAAILDIMGVRGYDLLELCRQKAIPALMLTAHALSPDHLTKSINAGALAYIPKDDIMNISDYVGEILQAGQTGTQTPGPGLPGSDLSSMINSGRIGVIIRTHSSWILKRSTIFWFPRIFQPIRARPFLGPPFLLNSSMLAYRSFM